MFGDLQSQLKTLDEKRNVGLRAGDTATPDKLLKYFTEMATRVLEAERCSIFVVDPETDIVWLKAGTDLYEHDIEVSTEGSIVGRVIESGETVIESDLEHKEGAHRKIDEQTGFVTHNVICVPVWNDALKKTVGAIQVLNKKDGEEFDQEDEAALREMAEHVDVYVNLTFLDQQIVNVSERVMTAANKWVNYLMAAVALLIVAVLGFAVL